MTMSAATGSAGGDPGGLAGGDRIDPAIGEQASLWMARLWSGEAGEAERAACARWRAAHPDHERAWRRLEALDARLRSVPADLAGPVLGSRTGPRAGGRRRALKVLGLGASVAGLAAVLRHRDEATALWAMHRTATGEIGQIRLPDGSDVVLGPSTALDLDYAEHERRLLLHRGEVLVSTATAPHADERPLCVACPEGTIEALGTRFMVRREQAGVRVAVFEGAVDIRPARAAMPPLRVDAGRQTIFDEDHIDALRGVSADAAAWTRGVLVAESMPLGELVAELARYRRGVLRCEPAVARLRASGIYSLRDTDRALDSLARALPVTVRRITPWWVTVQGLDAS